MATVSLHPIPSPRPQRRFTVEEYHRLLESGILRSGEPCELIHGLLVEKAVINPPHASTVQKLTKALFRRLGFQCVIRMQLPLTLPPDSEPEPDGVVALGREDDYDHRHPGPGEVALVIEIADSTLAEDRTTKLGLYAFHEVPVYWIVNLVERQVEVYSDPRQGPVPAYQHQAIFGIDDQITLTIPGQPIQLLQVREIIPT
jgi:Uma2 family endonuclease